MATREEIQTYSLNCDKCGDVFESQRAFPKPHICPQCSKGEEINKVLILATGKTGAHLDKVKQDLSDLGVVIKGSKHVESDNLYYVEQLIEK